MKTFFVATDDRQSLQQKLDKVNEDMRRQTRCFAEMMGELDEEKSKIKKRPRIVIADRATVHLKRVLAGKELKLLWM